MISLIAAWQLLGLLILVLGVKVIDLNRKSKCPCGIEFEMEFPRLEKVVEPIVRHLPQNKPRDIKGWLIASPILLFAFQWVPLYFCTELYWRLLKTLHGKHCLPYQMSEVGKC